MSGATTPQSLTPSESQARATSCKAAAPAVRPPTTNSRRGRRSSAALSRRQRLWYERCEYRQRCAAEEIAEPDHFARHGFMPSSTPNFTDFPGFWPGPAGAPGGPGAAGEGIGISHVGSNASLPASVWVGRTVYSHQAVAPPKGVADPEPFSPSTSPSACEPRTEGLDSCSVSFLHANVQGFLSKSAEIAFLVESNGFPEIIGFTETFLDKSKPSDVEGYVEIARLDRRTGEKQGGIILYAKWGFEGSIVHVGDSDVHERSWFVLHTDRGAILLGLWYRRPAANEIESIESLYDELDKHGTGTIYTIIMGDMNVHEESWLRYSDGTSLEGRELQTLSNVTGLSERVGKPTRGDNLLDLVLSDLEGDLKCKVVPGVSDHNAVLGVMNFAVPEDHVVERELFDYKTAPWADLNRDFASYDWYSALAGLDADEAASAFTRVVMEKVRRRVRCKKSSVQISSHPWLNDRCRAAIRQKIAARGSPTEIQARNQCSEVLFEEHAKYVQRMRTKLQKMPSSKKWWKLSNSLQGRSRGQGHGVQSLKRSDGSWARDSGSKAELLSETFLRKSALPDECVNEYSDLPPGHPIPPDSFLPVRTKAVRKQLRRLNVDKATGPDSVSCQVLKKCADTLARPLTMVLRTMLRTGRWPSCWRYHNVVPLHKKKSRSDPDNYRGVHLTSQISKAVERVVGRLFLPGLERRGVYGDRQFAYSAGRGHRDALALSVLSWLMTLEQGMQVGLYCSDVSGAFDRVDQQRITEKLKRSGIHPQIFRLLCSWLEPRTSVVVLDGKKSSCKTLQNSVYQGTVLGPPLWNIHYADSTRAVEAEGFTEVIFADDLNCSKAFSATTPESEIRRQLQRCQKSLHRWGSANRVLFDPGKESYHCLHRTRYFGDNFKILGVLFDCQLTMGDAAQETAREAGWKVRSILRCRKFYSTPELMKLYKSQVLSFIESRTAAIHHAAPSVLDAIDRVQRRFLREIGLTELEALEQYRLAPLPVRRDIAMLGLLHRVCHGYAPRPLAELFEPKSSSQQMFQPDTRGHRVRHGKQLVDFIGMGGHTETLRRSCYGLVTVWNLLPKEAAAAKTTKTCQRLLQKAVLRRAQRAPGTNWQRFLATEAKVMPIHTFQRLFF